MPASLILVFIGLIGGVTAGLFGIGGGIIIVPALVYWAGFSQHMATGTTLALLLPPVGLAAAYEYYRHGNIDIRAALILAATMFVGSWLGARLANELNEGYLHLGFGLFVCGLGIYLVYRAGRNLGYY